MKQEPVCPSMNQKTILSLFPKRSLVCSKHVNSIGIEFVCTVAIIVNIVVFLFMFFCLHVKKEIIPLSSTVEVQFQEAMKPISSLTSITADQKIDQETVPFPLVEDSIHTLPQVRALPTLTLTQPVKPNNYRVPKKEMTPVLKTGSQEKSVEATASKIEPSAPLISHVFPSQRCSSPQGIYPLAARRRHEQGVVKIALQILSNGQVRQVKLVETSGFDDLDQAAIEAVQQIKCSAVENKNTLVQTSTLVHFELQHH